MGEQHVPPGQFFCGLMVNSPRKDSCMQPDDEAERQYNRQRQQLREALALLALVAHVDNTAWKRLLETHCGIRVLGLDEAAEGEFAPRFMLELPVGRRIAADDYNSLVRGHFVHGSDGDGALHGDLVTFCGVEQHASPTREYQAALAKIAAIWRQKEPSCNTVVADLEVPIAVSIGPWVARSDRSMIDYVHSVQRAVRHIREASWQRAASLGGDALPRVTFVLESIAVDLRPLEVKTELAKLMKSLAHDGIRCSGLAFRQDLGNSLVAPARKAAARKAVGQLYTSLFGGTRPSAIALGTDQNNSKAKSITGPSASLERPLDELAVRCMHFHCGPTRNWVFERLCSAAAVNQTTANVSLQLDEGTEQHQWRWQWIGYAFFSERARMYSSLQGLTLQEARITGEDVEAMASVLTSNGPEEDLLGLPHQEESSDVSIKAKASMKLLSVSAEETLGNSTRFNVLREIRGAKLLGNSDDHGWVDVLVPGFGKCQTQRTNLLRERRIASWGV